MVKRGELLQKTINLCRKAITDGMDCLREGKDDEKPALGYWGRSLGDIAQEKIQWLVEQGRVDVDGYLEVKEMLEEQLGFMNEEAIYKKCPDGRPLILASLAGVCGSIYRQDPDNNTEYFDEGIKRAKEVLDIIRIGVANVPFAERSARNTLSKLYLVAFERSGKLDDLQKALNETTKALNSQNPQQLFSPYGKGDIKFHSS